MVGKARNALARQGATGRWRELEQGELAATARSAKDN